MKQHDLEGLKRENGSHLSNKTPSLRGGFPLSSPLNSHTYMDYLRRQTKTNATHNDPCPGNAYLRQALGHDLLTPDQETDLGRKALSGDIEARNTLMTHNQRFLLKLVGEFHARHQNLEYDDLISEANLGLMRAAEKYDPSTGNRFVTYCRYWILQSLTRFANQQSLPVRLPDHRAEQLKKIRSAVIDSKTKDPATISRVTGIETEAVKMLLPYISGTISLDAKIRTPDGDEGESFGDLLLPVDVDYLEPLRNSELLEVLEQLPEKQREVLMHRFGAYGRKKMTLQELADKYGITRERVRQIESKALIMCRRLGQKLA